MSDNLDNLDDDVIDRLDAGYLRDHPRKQQRGHPTSG